MVQSVQSRFRVVADHIDRGLCMKTKPALFSVRMPRSSEENKTTQEAVRKNKHQFAKRERTQQLAAEINKNCSQQC